MRTFDPSWAPDGKIATFLLFSCRQSHIENIKYKHQCYTVPSKSCLLVAFVVVVVIVVVVLLLLPLYPLRLHHRLILYHFLLVQ